MRKFTLACIGMLAGGLCAYGQVTFPRNGAYDERPGRYAFTNATIVVAPGTTLKQATLLIENGEIREVGTSVTIPEGTVTTDLGGRYIYPSFIDLHSDYGMPEAKPRPSAGRTAPQLDSDKKGAFGWNQAINAEQQAAAVFSANPDQATELRKAGFGTVLTHIRDGIVRGTGALVTLHAAGGNKAVLKGSASSHFSFSKGTSTQNYPNSAMGAVALLRQHYYDADWYARGGAGREYNLSLEQFNRLKELPAFFEAADKWALLRADKIGDEFGVQYIIKGSGDEYQRLAEIRDSKAPVIVPLNFPEAYDVSDAWDAEVVTLAELKHWELAPANPGLLSGAGVAFALTASGLKTPSDFLTRVRTAVEQGLPEDKALESLTTTPAALIRANDRIGALKKGYVANFLITSGELFKKETVILENWVQGTPYVLQAATPEDFRGTYRLTLEEKEAGRLHIGGSRYKPDFTLHVNDTLKITPQVSVVNKLLSISYAPDKKKPGTIRLAGWIDSTGLFTGSGTLENGTPVAWKAVRTEPFREEAPRPDSASVTGETGKVWFPFAGYGSETPPLPETLLIRNATVWTNEKEGVLSGTDVLVQKGKIAAVGRNISAPAGARILDGTGKHLTSGIVDEHSHIALFAVNEGSQSSSAEVRMADVINPDDVNIYRQLAGGVTTSQLLHGSANAIGGQSAVIKLKWGASPTGMLLPEARYIKFALGENVKQSNWGDAVRVRYPQTRMGVEQVYYDHFIRAREYAKEWKAFHALKNKAGAAVPRRDLELDALAEILNHERFITCHSYVQSEINMLMAVADSLKFNINTFTHILEGYKLADKMAARKIGGSTFADWWAYKMEVKEAIPYNAALMAREGVVVSINSDDAEMARRLNQEAAKVVAFGGVSEEDAWKMVTLNPARLLRLDHRIGSIKKGKDGDLVLWNAHPLSIYASPDYTIIEGAVYFSREEDSSRRRVMSSEKNRLIQKSLAAKAGGAATQSPRSRTPRMWHCEDILGEHAEHHDHEAGER